MAPESRPTADFSPIESLMMPSPYNLRQLHADAGLPQGSGVLVTDDTEREVDKDWRQSRSSWSLCHIPIDGGYLPKTSGYLLPFLSLGMV